MRAQESLIFNTISSNSVAGFDKSKDNAARVSLSRNVSRTERIVLFGVKIVVKNVSLPVVFSVTIFTITVVNICCGLTRLNHCRFCKFDDIFLKLESGKAPANFHKI